MALQEDDWEELLHNILKKKCTSFIGAGACTPWIPLGSELASKWSHEHGYPLDDHTSLHRVAQFLAIKNGDDLYPKILLSRYLEKLPPPNFSLERYRETPYALLADLHLPLYITTNYDKFMEEALRIKGKSPVTEFCRWNNYAREAEIPSVFDRRGKYSPSENKPLVYHLHGVIDLPQSMVLTEKDYIDFMVNLSSDKNTEILPSLIRIALVSHSLLFVGYSLSDMNFRIIFRSIMNSVGKGLMSKNIAVLLPPNLTSDENPNSQRAKEYLDRYAKDMFKVQVYWGQASDFSKELRNRWDLFRR
jgi:hypothetical protein